MQVSKTWGYTSESNKEDKTTTEASSELHLDHTLLQNNKPEPPEDDLRRTQTKLKYRKLRQKLNSMGFQHDDKCSLGKDVSSEKKQRIMKLALDLEKQIKIQNRDYEVLEVTAREIHKIIESNREHNLHHLRQSRFIPALFQLLIKVPTLHKAEFAQSLRGLQLCFRIMHGFASISSNRQYLILTNRLNGLISFSSWILGREDKKTPTSFYLHIQYLTFRIINSLLLHRSREQDIQSITDTTVQLILCSQIFKKIKITLTEHLFQEDSLVQTDTVQELLKFMLFVMRKACPKIQSDYSNLNQSQKEQPVHILLFKLVQFVVPFLLGYFLQLKQTQSIPTGQLLPESYPLVTQCCMSLTVKVINCCCEVAMSAFRRTILDSKLESVLGSFIISCCSMIKYCKRQMEQYNDTNYPQGLLNELIILLGYLSLEDVLFQKKINDTSLLQQIFNLPVQYIMDSYLRDVYIPTFCCLIRDNKSNLNQFLKDNSPQPLIKALKKEMATHLSLSRKGSTSSLVSMAHILPEYTSANYQTDRIAMQLRFPMIYWQSLCSQLQKHV